MFKKRINKKFVTLKFWQNSLKRERRKTSWFKHFPSIDFNKERAKTLSSKEYLLPRGLLFCIFNWHSIKLSDVEFNLYFEKSGDSAYSIAFLIRSLFRIFSKSKRFATFFKSEATLYNFFAFGVSWPDLRTSTDFNNFVERTWSTKKKTEY